MNTNVTPYIFRSQPKFSPKVWGGRRLATNWQKCLPSTGVYGESWEVADLIEGQSLVENGLLSGSTLARVAALWREKLYGQRCSHDGFPLLVKILDANDDLSIQVHPGVEDLPALGNTAASKDECWVVLETEPDAHVLHGFRTPLSHTELRDAVNNGTIINALQRVDVTAGDIIRVPPGTVHAICKGVVLLEIQQPSDTTYRLYDYNRLGLDGKPRPLHIDESISVIRMQSQPNKMNFFEMIRNDRPCTLIDTEHYRIEGMRVDESMRWRIDSGSAQIVFIMSGQCELIDSDEQRLVLQRGQTAVIPASIGEVNLNRCGDHDCVEVIVSGLGGHPLIDIIHR